MAWSDLQSSNLEAYDYDADMRVLHVRFRGGRQYSFGEVPQDTVDGLVGAESPGRHFAAHIKPNYKVIW